MAQWVQHKSGIGEKWELCAEGFGVVHNADTSNSDWQVYTKRVGLHCHYLPKSEYIPCEPPEEWEDVTGECEWWHHECHAISDRWKDEYYIKHGSARIEGFPDRYRLVKRDGLHNGPHFLVERKKV